MSERRPFHYFRDSLFLISLGLWFVNRFFLRPNWEWTFFHAYFNDILCIPVIVPVILTLSRRLGGRENDGPPTALEIMLPLCLVTVLFELLLPVHPFWKRYNVYDPYDIIAYCAGALFAYEFWHYFHNTRKFVKKMQISGLFRKKNAKRKPF